MSQKKAMKVTQVKPWRETIKICQMKWFKHLIRLRDNTSTKTALKCLNEKIKRPQDQKRKT